MIIHKRSAEAIREICVNLYQKSISSVYDYCNKIKLDYSYCKGCEAETPIIETLEDKTCALCGQYTI